MAVEINAVFAGEEDRFAPVAVGHGNGTRGKPGASKTIESVAGRAGLERGLFVDAGMAGVGNVGGVDGGSKAVKEIAREQDGVAFVPLAMSPSGFAPNPVEALELELQGDSVGCADLGGTLQNARNDKSAGEDQEGNPHKEFKDGHAHRTITEERAGG